MRKSSGGGIAQAGGGHSAPLAYSTYNMDPNGLANDRGGSKTPTYTMRGSSPMRSSSQQGGQYGSSGQLPPADNYSNNYHGGTGGRADYMSSQGGRPSSGSNSRHGTPTRQQMPVWR